MTRRRREQVTPLFPAATSGASVQPDTLPPGHPLEFWDVETAAERTKLSVSFLQASNCPRVNIRRRVLFDPIETVLWVRRHLSNRSSAAS
ncbi:hypothetical protein [Gemmatimonas sp.]